MGQTPAPVADGTVPPSVTSMPDRVSGITLKRDMPNRIVQLVSGIPGAIGYVPLWITARANVQVLAIDGVSPSTQALLQGTYRFWSVGHMYTEGDGTSQAQAFLQFVDSAQEIPAISAFAAVRAGASGCAGRAGHRKDTRFPWSQRADSFWQ